MRFPKLIEAEFLSRLNRFVCLVKIDSKTFHAYVRNTGRLTELLYRGKRIYLREKGSGKYPYEVLLVLHENKLVCVDSQLATKVYAESLGRKVTYEPRILNRRLDLLLDNTLIEVKSVNLVKEGIALFPDAPTERGREHIELLMKVYPEFVPKVVFVVMREDAKVFSPNWDTDPSFSRKLKEFFEAGHEVRAYVCQVSLEDIKLKREIPIKL